MSAFTKTSPLLVLTAALLVAGGLACSKPAAAPAAAPKAAPAPVAQADDSADRQRAEAEQKRKADEAAEAARKAAAEAQYRQAAAAALQDVHFDFDKSDIKASDKPVLTAISSFMKTYPQANLFIDGNCDERGTVEYNLALGEHRAQAALNYLVALGVPAIRLSTTSYGKEKPVCTESVESCWSRNRRAHFTLK
ncbi:MAG: OmpA family protein [Holophaga sp.]|nr:OmpA family protein [Holophaga sp.]